MKTDKTSCFLSLGFCWAVFSFAVAVPPAQTHLKAWIVSLFLNGIIYIIYTLLLFEKVNNKPLVNFLLIIYILFLTSKQFVRLSEYARLFHGQTLVLTNIVITVLLILYLINFFVGHSVRTAAPLLFMVVIMLFMTVVLNAEKIRPSNLYVRIGAYNLGYYNVTLFDYIIPLYIILKEHPFTNKKKTVKLIITVFFTLSGLSVLAFSCIKGNLLYSISPLQILFQTASSNLIESYDYLFTFFVYFGYFSALVILMTAYNLLKQSFTHINALDLLFIAPLAYLYTLIGVRSEFYLTLAMVAIIYIGGKKVNIYEKN